MAAVEAALATEEKTFVVVAQRDASVEQPGLDDLYTVGTRAVIKKVARGENGIEMIVQGVERVAILKAEQTEPYLKARVRPLPWPDDSGTEVEALYRAVLELAARRCRWCSLPTPINIQQLAAQADDPLRLAYLLGSMLSLDVAKEQALLEAPTRVEALRLIHGYLSHEVQVLELRQKITSPAETEMTKQQRDYMLRQQMQAIQEELGEQSPEKAEVDELRRRLTEADLPDEVRKEAERELTPAGADAGRRPGLPGDAAPTWNWSWNCPGRRPRKTSSTWRRPGRCSTRTTTTWRRSRSASSKTWRC